MRANGNCVAVAQNLPDVIGVRDSKNPSGPVLLFTPVTWTGFVDSIKTGDFEA